MKGQLFVEECLDCEQGLLHMKKLKNCLLFIKDGRREIFKKEKILKGLIWHVKGYFSEPGQDR